MAVVFKLLIISLGNCDTYKLMVRLGLLGCIAEFDKEN